MLPTLKQFDALLKTPKLPRLSMLVWWLILCQVQLVVLGYMICLRPAMSTPPLSQTAVWQCPLPRGNATWVSDCLMFSSSPVQTNISN